MKLLILRQVEQQTLREMGIFHPHPRVRIRAQAIVRLSQGLTLPQTANEFHVHLNSIEAWRQRWNKQGLMGLYQGRHAGRKRKWTAASSAPLMEARFIPCRRYRVAGTCSRSRLGRHVVNSSFQESTASGCRRRVAVFSRWCIFRKIRVQNCRSTSPHTVLH